MTGSPIVWLLVTLGLGWWQAPSVPAVRLTLRRLTLRMEGTQWSHLGSSARPFWLVSALALGVALWFHPLLASLAAGLVLGVVRLVRIRRAGVARHEATAALPESLELCMVTLGAGGTVTDCLRTLAENGRHPARTSASTALRLLSEGSLLDDALLAFQHELGPSYQPLSGALRLASEHGGSIGALLDRLAIEARAERRRAGQLRARRLSVVLLVPLVAFSLPAVLVGVLLPVALVALRSVS